MLHRAHRCVGATLAVLILATPAKSKALMIAPMRPGDQVVQADAIVLGKVVSIEKDTIDVTPFPGAAADQKVAHKVAVIKVQESLMGGTGLTEYRVGFQADAGGPIAPPGGGLPRRPINRGLIALSADMEGCFLLVRHHSGEFFTLVPNGRLLQKKDEDFAKEVETIKKTIRFVDAPVEALKAKDLQDRYDAAVVILQRYQMVRTGSTKAGRAPKREPIPAEENKLIIALLKELPWSPAADKPVPFVRPNRQTLWNYINPIELGFKFPKAPARAPGEPPVDYNKQMDELSSAFLKEKGDTIQIKRYASE